MSRNKARKILIKLLLLIEGNAKLSYPKAIQIISGKNIARRVFVVLILWVIATSIVASIYFG